MNDRSSLLILSFSEITNDARVLKQVRRFTADYSVTTCSYGHAPEGVAHHIQIPNTRLPWKWTDVLLQSQLFSLAYRLDPRVREAHQALRHSAFDAILANDIDTVPLALSLRPASGVHADLHEYWPRIHDGNPGWMRRFGAWYAWMCRKYLPQCSAVTTVSVGLQKEYEREFGLEVGLVTNAAPYHDLAPTPVDEPIRLVHSGAGTATRNLDAMVDGVAEVDGFTLDLYLIPSDPDYVDRLRRRTSDNQRITIHDPVPYDQLIDTLNDYDVGVFLLEPITFSYANALPNKIFDFLQARLGIIVGPTPEMAAMVREHHLGTVTDGNSATDLARTLATVTPKQVSEWKRSSVRVAPLLHSDTEVQKWATSVEDIISNAGTTD